jgi:hypothetical protein
MNTGSSLLGDAIAALQHFWVFLVNESSKVSTIIEDQVEALVVLESDKLLL